MNNSATTVNAIINADSVNFADDGQNENRDNGRHGRGQDRGRGSGRTNRVERRTCYECGQRGHLMYDCPQLNEGKSDVDDSQLVDPIICSECDGKGHLAVECPTKCGLKESSINRRSSRQKAKRKGKWIVLKR